MPEEGGWLTWREATQQALYGDDGFFLRHLPGDHFRTSVVATPLFAGALLTLARIAGLDTVVDVGAGGGELLADLHRLDPALSLHGVDLAPRPVDLPRAVSWAPSVPDGLHDALVVANEWLDDVPVDVVELTAEGWRLVLVDPQTGDERLGPEPDRPDAGWLAAWWPAGDEGDRAEVGRPRDEAWAAVVRCLRRGLAVAVDYAHDRATRPRHGSLTGYREGHQVRPVPDGSCDLTSHVALDACAAAGEAAGATDTAVTTQRAALRALGVRGRTPPVDLARTDPAAYVRALAAAGEAAELTSTIGLGDFGWLVQGVGVDVPQPLTGTES